MSSFTSGGFTGRSSKTEAFIKSVKANILTPERYFDIPTGIEYRFGEESTRVHELLYRSMGPTTDLLRYFPDNLYLDRCRRLPTWETEWTTPQVSPEPLDIDATGLFSFFVEYKYSDSERRAPLKGVETKYIGIIEREAWLTYKRLTAPNPSLGIYLDGKRTLIALFYVATYAPDRLYANWEHLIQPIDDERAVIKTIARPQLRSEAYSRGSGTPWINFDIRTLKPLERFLAEDLFWEQTQALEAVKSCKKMLFGK
jgi:hypothetical protein